MTLTCLNNDRHGCLLNDGAYSGEGSKTTVVSPAVLLYRVGEVQVSIQAHGHPFILLYVLQIWGAERKLLSDVFIVGKMNESAIRKNLLRCRASEIE